KIRRGNYVFFSWIGDHGHHVHVFREGRLVVKWDLDNRAAIEGDASQRVRRLIDDLVREGRL
ncbi:MAG: hypothetical protein Q8M55_08010, partial [Actinomycetota bacterium]|nr:hypothetical protein [Actinomycetota bacterium]